MRVKKILEEREIYLCFEHRGIVLLPHYTEGGWIGPGPERTQRLMQEYELRALGAKPLLKALWRRRGHTAVTGNSPLGEK
jgi:hypothetical protein